MILNNEHKLEYRRYGSIRSVFCKHCNTPLVDIRLMDMIYHTHPTFYEDGAGRLKCTKCNNRVAII